jgi:hypothetical protein
MMLASIYTPSIRVPSQRHVAICGDELEACLCALMLLRQGIAVTLYARYPERLGGLSTRGGLAYMDITPEGLPPLMAWVIKQCGFKRVALHAETTHTVLHRLLLEAGCTIRPYSAFQQALWNTNPQHPRIAAVLENDGTHHPVDALIDATPDATVAHQLGHPSLLGLNGVFEASDLSADVSTPQSLGVSPIFRIRGLCHRVLQQAEATFRESAEAPELMRRHMPWLSEQEREALLNRPTYAPDEEDYLDILSPCIGVAYHHWRFGETEVYETAPHWIDGFNIARLLDGTLSFNGLIMRLPLNQQLAISEEGQPPTPEMHHAMQDVLAFLKQFTGIETLDLISPEEVYIRQTRLTQARQILSARHVLMGGVPAEESIGSFSYWLDYRGVHAWRYYPELAPLPKPCFNATLAPHCSPLADNFFLLNRSAGFSPLAQGICRIVQYNAMIGEALALALAVAFREDCPAWQVPAREVRHLHSIQAMGVGEPLHPHDSGFNALTQPLAESPLLQRDDAIAFSLLASKSTFLVEAS